MKLKELPETELPRERLLNVGETNLTNEELLSIILRTGTKNNSVKEVSMNILSNIDNINELNNIDIYELSKIKGVGLVKAITIKASIELGKRVNNLEIKNLMKLNNSDIVHDTFKSLFIGLKQERLLAIYLDNKKRLINYKVITIGTKDETLFHPRDIIYNAIKCNASGIIIIHNHPSLDIKPSNADINMTNKLIESCNIVGIPLLDHLITNTKNYYSFFKECNK
ncbi:MAG: DNA repair protein RadC [Bacilli bacterium]|nr:DNA repair protein RadC [Bacilli bacterium]